MAPLNASFEQWSRDLGTVDARVQQLISSDGSMSSETDTARDQIQQVNHDSYHAVTMSIQAIQTIPYT